MPVGVAIRGKEEEGEREEEKETPHTHMSDSSSSDGEEDKPRKPTRLQAIKASDPVKYAALEAKEAKRHNKEFDGIYAIAKAKYVLELAEWEKKNASKPKRAKRNGLDERLKRIEEMLDANIPKVDKLLHAAMLSL